MEVNGTKCDKINSFFTVIIGCIVLGMFLVPCRTEELMILILFLLRTERGSGNQMTWLWLPSKLLVIVIM